MTTTREPIDPTARAWLLQALASSEQASSMSCAFQFCPGPGKRFVPMATCHVCRTTQLLRKAVRKLDLKGQS